MKNPKPEMSTATTSTTESASTTVSDLVAKEKANGARASYGTGSAIDDEDLVSKFILDNSIRN